MRNRLQGFIGHAPRKAPAQPGRRRLLVCCLAIGLATPLAAAETAVPSAASSPSGEQAFVEALLAKMTLEEKLGQLNQPPGLGNDTGPKAMAGGEDQIRKGQIGSLLGTHGAALTCRLQRVAVEQSRLGIPL